MSIRINHNVTAPTNGEAAMYQAGLQHLAAAVTLLGGAKNVIAILRKPKKGTQK